ncbi:GNAT family N-acetyltransferase [Aerococcaceae bacterium zg-ZJ1578]|uniref:N-acetyltransferase family protein n=1 Tax=Aerococcaceae bacterium zg-252 TaxID=2796928 RepID=UPI001A24D673|nr:GNAT family N-acetyltransferase [Aerococcaceae bacterium zg-1578]
MNQEIEAIVRLAEPQDARAIIGLCQQVGSETPYLTFGSKGLDLSVEQETTQIRRYQQSENSLLIVAEVDDQLVGMANLTAFNEEKQQHVAEIGICLIREYWGYGLAKMMMEMLLDFAEHSAIKVITLEVVQENVAAVGLYQSFDFEIVGKLSKRLCHECEYFDSYVMEKRIG